MEISQKAPLKADQCFFDASQEWKSAAALLPDVLEPQAGKGVEVTHLQIQMEDLVTIVCLLFCPSDYYSGKTQDKI